MEKKDGVCFHIIKKLWRILMPWHLSLLPGMPFCPHYVCFWPFSSSDVWDQAGKMSMLPFLPHRHLLPHLPRSPLRHPLLAFLQRAIRRSRDGRHNRAQIRAPCRSRSMSHPECSSLSRDPTTTSSFCEPQDRVKDSAENLSELLMVDHIDQGSRISRRAMALSTVKRWKQERLSSWGGERPTTVAYSRSSETGRRRAGGGRDRELAYAPGRGARGMTPWRLRCLCHRDAPADSDDFVEPSTCCRRCGTSARKPGFRS